MKKRHKHDWCVEGCTVNLNILYNKAAHPAI